MYFMSVQNRVRVRVTMNPVSPLILMKTEQDRLLPLRTNVAKGKYVSMIRVRVRVAMNPVSPLILMKTISHGAGSPLALKDKRGKGKVSET